MYDVVVIGAGICGTSIARELSKYQVKVLVLDKENDVAMGTTKANSGIVHAGYDPQPGTLMAKYNVEGNRLIEGLCKELDVPYQKIGSLVLAFSDEDLAHIQKLYERGIANGVVGLELLTGEEVGGREPHIHEKVMGGLYAPSAAVVGPYELAIAQIDHAVINGVEVKLNHKAEGIQLTEEGFEIKVNTGETTHIHKSHYVVNAAGLYADQIASMVEPVDFRITPQKGQYYLLDKSQGTLVNHVVFQCPTEKGKGILVAPTAHGNLIVGPDATDCVEGADVSTTVESLDYIREMAAKTCEHISYRDNIRNFSGNRALTDKEDFIVAYAKVTEHWVNVAGIKSPGLTSAPAIALDVIKMLETSGLSLKPQEKFEKMRNVKRITTLSQEALNELIKEKPAFGRIVCRCEKVSEGEIIEAIHSPVAATTVEAVKRRVRAGAGRCQGGFCSPKVVELLGRELGLPWEAICLDQKGSYILDSKANKGGDNDGSTTL